MNVIYLLTNLNKKEGEKRFYIGSKNECRLEIINGLPTIIDIKSERPYLGSATCLEMKQDIINGHKFSATILKEIKKGKILEEENFFIKQHNAVYSLEYYNRGEAVVGGGAYDHNAIINFFGEKRKDFNASKSGISKRHKTAKRFGFANLAEFAIWIHKEKLSGLNSVQISAKINCERHTPSRFIENWDMVKCFKELDNKSDLTRNSIRDFYVKGASIHKISELTGLEIPTVCVYMGEFKIRKEKDFLAATRKNLTEEELQFKIVELYMQGIDLRDVGKMVGLNYTTLARYFNKYVRKHLPTPDTLTNP